MVVSVKRHAKSFKKNVKKISSSILHADKASTLIVLRDWFNSSEDYEEYSCTIVKPYYKAIKEKLLEKNFEIQDMKIYKVGSFFVCTYVIKAKTPHKGMLYSMQSNSGEELILYTAAIVSNVSCKKHNHCAILHAR